MWTSNGWFGIDRMQSSLQEGMLFEATDERSAREAAVRFSSKPENKERSYHVSKMGDKHHVSLYPGQNDVAVYKGGKCISEATHTVDWDGPTDVTVVKRTPEEIEVRRVDSEGKPLTGDEHSMTYSRGEPEFKQIASKEDAVDDHEAWREKRAARLQGRVYHESRETKLATPIANRVRAKMNESAMYLNEGTVPHGSYELTVGKRTTLRETGPSHVVAHIRKMNKLGVPVHDHDDYGDTVSVRVKNTRTGTSTLHHVYQRGLSSREDEQTRRLVSVRPVGRATDDSRAHNEVIMNYLSGKRAKE